MWKTILNAAGALRHRGKKILQRPLVRFTSKANQVIQTKAEAETAERIRLEEEDALEDVEVEKVAEGYRRDKKDKKNKRKEEKNRKMEQYRAKMEAKRAKKEAEKAAVPDPKAKTEATVPAPEVTVPAPEPP